MSNQQQLTTPAGSSRDLYETPEEKVQVLVESVQASLQIQIDELRLKLQKLKETNSPSDQSD